MGFKPNTFLSHMQIYLPLNLHTPPPSGFHCPCTRPALIRWGCLPRLTSLRKGPYSFTTIMGPCSLLAPGDLLYTSRPWPAELTPWLLTSWSWQESWMALATHRDLAWWSFSSAAELHLLECSVWPACAALSCSRDPCLYYPCRATLPAVPCKTVIFKAHLPLPKPLEQYSTEFLLLLFPASNMS